LKNLILEILNLCEINKSRTLKSSSEDAIKIKENLKNLNSILVAKISLDEKKYSTHISLGFGYFPKIPWLGITKKNQKVSAHNSICICFSSRGEGIVAGAMSPFPIKSGELTTVFRNKQTEKFISLKGGNNETTYNSKFFNPLDFFMESFEEAELIKHIKDSFKFLNS
jgi:hypothetical protein